MSYLAMREPALFCSVLTGAPMPPRPSLLRIRTISVAIKDGFRHPYTHGIMETKALKKDALIFSPTLQLQHDAG